MVDETLKPNRQCAKAAKNANSIMRAIKASFIDITPALFHNFYGAFIRSPLGFGVTFRQDLVKLGLEYYMLIIGDIITKTEWS